MRRLSAYIEINGESVYVGEIVGKDSNDACFTYADAYLENPEHCAISIGLPLEEKTFDAQRTRIFFEGWDTCVFNYLIGNTDNHIKNLSLLYSEDLKSVRLAPAYDIVSTMIYKSSTENMAFSIDGICNINEITRASFEKAAAQVGIGPKMAMKRFDAMVNGFVDAINRAKEELRVQGFDQVEQIRKMIMEKGGIRKEINNA